MVKAQSESNILKEFHELIQESKEQFTKELESLMPEVKLGEKGDNLYLFMFPLKRLCKSYVGLNLRYPREFSCMIAMFKSINLN